MKFDEENNIVGKARNESIDASYKDLCEVCNNIRNLNVNEALDFLEKASLKKIPVLYRSHNKKLAHRKELNGKKGRYPVKAVKFVLRALKDAISNALVKGADKDKLIVAHACANKKATYLRLQPKGRRTRSNYTLSRIEIIVMQKGAKPIKIKTAQKKEEEKINESEKTQETKQEIKESVKEGKEEKGNAEEKQEKTKEKSKIRRKKSENVNKNNES
jgi:large subunit ribosomal protein L22